MFLPFTDYLGGNFSVIPNAREGEGNVGVVSCSEDRICLVLLRKQSIDGIVGEVTRLKNGIRQHRLNQAFFDESFAVVVEQFADTGMQDRTKDEVRKP